MLQVLLNGLSSASLYALAAVGLTLIFGVMKVIQFAHGEMAVVAAYVLIATTLAGGHPLVGIVMAVAVVVALAGLEYQFVIKRLTRAPHLNQIAATLGVALALEGTIVLLMGSDTRGVTNTFTRSVVTIGDARLATTRAVAIFTAIVALVCLGLVLSRSSFGRQVRAVAQDAQVAELMGVNSGSIQRSVFFIGSVFSGMAGLFLVMSADVRPTSGLTLTMVSFAVVILGGVGSPVGALIAALLVGFGEALVGAYLPGGTAWISAVAFLIIIVTAVGRPEGLRRAI